MPNTWDVTAAGKPSTCASGTYGAAATDTACKAVEKYLDSQAATQTDFADALWTSGADGPWKLTKMDDLGQRHVHSEPDVLWSDQGSKGHRLREGRSLHDGQRGRDRTAQWQSRSATSTPPN
jgi:hypothetical protein